MDDGLGFPSSLFCMLSLRARTGGKFRYAQEPGQSGYCVYSARYMCTHVTGDQD